MSGIGIPYAIASIRDDGRLIRICPICDVGCVETVDENGEQTSDAYQRHYETVHSLVWTHYRMNDYVGPGIFATVTWTKHCTNDCGHSLGLLSQTCSRCGDTPEIEYEERS